MSLILEALKKSERQRQIGSAPTLATPPMSRKRKRSLLPWLVGAIAIAAVAGWWLSRENSPESVPPADVQNAAPASTPMAATAKKLDAPMTTVAPPPVDNVEPTAPTSPPVVSTEKQIAEAAAAIAAAAPPASKPPATPPPAPAPSVPSKPLPGVVEPAASPAAGTVPVAPIVTAPATSAPPIAAPPVAALPPSATASLPLLWELPYEKRKDIPALVMSLQVYAADPAQRFAIINDERHVEGDVLGEGLKLQEITPDGLIVEYRGERFLFPRGGR